MKLNLNAEELLALHNLLRDTLDVTGDRSKEPLTVDTARLRQVYNRVRAHFVNAFAARDKDDPLEAVMAREQSKIDRLRSDIHDVKKDQAGLAVLLKDKDFIIPTRDDDLDVPDYPKRGRRSGGRNRGR